MLVLSQNEIKSQNYKIESQNYEIKSQNYKTDSQNNLNNHKLPEPKKVFRIK